MRLGNDRLVVDDGTVGRRVLHEHTAHVLGGIIERVFVTNNGFEAQALGASLDDRDRLRVALVGDVELRLLTAVQRGAHRHGLGGGGSLVQ